MKEEAPKHIDERLFAKFLSGETSPDELNMFLEWLDSSDKNMEQFHQYQKLWSLSKNSQSFNADLAWKKIDRRITKRKRSLQIVYSSIAAAIVIFAIFFTQFNNNSKLNQEPLFALSDINEDVKAELPDGSEITLSAQSQIKYYLDSNANTRIAELQGEAYFSIKKDSSQKFIVNTPFGGVEVLGTKFNVNTLANNDVLVDVLSGTVKLFLLQDNNDTLFLIITNKESAVISIQSNSIKKRVQESSVFYRINKSITFKNTELKKVFTELEKCYSVSIKTDSIIDANLKFTSSFKENSIDEILTIITETLDLKFTKTQDKYLIKPNDN